MREPGPLGWVVGRKDICEMKGGLSRFGSEIPEVRVNGHRHVPEQTFARCFPSCPIHPFFNEYPSSAVVLPPIAELLSFHGFHPQCSRAASCSSWPWFSLSSSNSTVGILVLFWKLPLVTGLGLSVSFLTPRASHSSALNFSSCLVTQFCTRQKE